MSITKKVSNLLVTNLKLRNMKVKMLKFLFVLVYASKILKVHWQKTPQKNLTNKLDEEK